MDGTRVAIWGGSYGGFLSYQLVTREPTRYRASVIRAGLADMVRHYQTGPGFRRSAINWLNGTLEENQAYYEKISAQRDVAKVQTPMLIYHGTPDRSVHISQSRQWVAAMRTLGKPIEFYEFDRDDHAISRKETWRVVLAKVGEFYRKHVMEQRTTPSAGAR